VTPTTTRPSPGATLASTDDDVIEVNAGPNAQVPVLGAPPVALPSMVMAQ
jgi:hypothetical protein